MNIVKSYGIILICNDNILLINRKHSIYYLEFMMGKYNLNDIKTLELIFSRITKREKDNIKNKEFSELWEELWGKIIKNNCKYNKINNKFVSLKKNKRLVERLYNIDNYENTEWEFSKGRKNNNEINIDCAIRELKEETNIGLKDYSLVKNILPIIEEYVSTNNVKYRICYYVAHYNKDMIDDIVDNDEVYKIKWININESSDYIRDYSKSKKNVINIIKSIINTYNKDYYIINNI